MSVKVYDIDAAQTVEQVMEPLTMPRYLVSKADYDALAAELIKFQDGTHYVELRKRIRELEAALTKIRDMPVGEFRPLTSEIEIWNIARAALTPSETAPGYPPAAVPPGGWPKAVDAVTFDKDQKIMTAPETAVKPKERPVYLARMTGRDLPCDNCGYGVDDHVGLGMPCPTSKITGVKDGP